MICPDLRRILAVSVLALSSTSACAQQSTAELWQEDTIAFLDVLTREHENPYHYTPEAEFNEEVEHYLSRLESLSYAQRVVGLARIVALIGDGHTWMPMHPVPFDGLPPGPAFQTLPIRFHLFDDGLFIVGTPDTHSDLLGCEVLQFEDTPTPIAIERVSTILPQDAVNFGKGFIPEWLMRSGVLTGLELADQDDELTLTLLCGDQTQSATFDYLPVEARYDWVFSDDTGFEGSDSWVTAESQIPLWRQEPFSMARHEPLDGAVYLQLNQIRNTSDRTLGEITQDAVDAASTLEDPVLVIDLRRNVGGNGQLNDDVMATITSLPQLLEPGGLYVLTSNATHSAAIMLVSDLEQQTQAVFVGAATADRPNHHGETNIFVTPNSGLPIVHASEYYQTSSPDDDRPYVSPDFPVAYTFTDYERGQDPALETVLNLIQGD